MIPFRYQLLGHLIIGIAVGFLLNRALETAGTEIDQKTAPFVTQSNMLLVIMEINQDAPPEILSVQPLSQGRITVIPAGEYTLILENDAGKRVYELPFRVLFLAPGDPPLPTDQVRMMLVVPYQEEVRKVVITSQWGSAEFSLTD